MSEWGAGRRGVSESLKIVHHGVERFGFVLRGKCLFS